MEPTPVVRISSHFRSILHAKTNSQRKTSKFSKLQNNHNDCKCADPLRVSEERPRSQQGPGQSARRQDDESGKAGEDMHPWRNGCPKPQVPRATKVKMIYLGPLAEPDEDSGAPFP